MLAAAARRAKVAEEREQALETIGERIEVAVRALRSLITDLRPAALDLGLQPALEALAERTTTMSGLEVDLRFDPASDSGAALSQISPELEDTIYRVVQEALTNVVKHAATGRAHLLIRETEGAIEVEIRVEGAGFDIEQESSGFGLVGIRERVALVGGTLSVETSPAVGTAVHISVPRAPEEKGETPAHAATG